MEFNKIKRSFSCSQNSLFYFSYLTQTTKFICYLVICSSTCIVANMNSLLRAMFLVYFITHIPITLSLDLQIIFGQYYPESLQGLATWYIATYNDQLLLTKPIWLQSFIWAEFLFQTPFFFVATYGLLFKRNWMRIPSIIYGAHVATTVWAIIAEFVASTTISEKEKLVLFSFYAPYFVIPALLMWYMAIHPVPFPVDAAKKVC